MPPSPLVKCKPYFKLRRLTHNFAWGSRRPAPWDVPALCAAYQWPTGLSGGGVIAIVELGGGWVQSDMDLYFTSLNQPAPQITDVSVDGTKNTPNQNVGAANDADYEVALDIQVSAAAYFAATGKAATIRVYWAKDIAPAVQKAAEDGCSVCSISWGADEAMWGTTPAQEMESAAATATDLGMVVFAASGDNDSSDGGSTPANVDVPASCPHVVGCGGTYKTASRRDCVERQSRKDRRRGNRRRVLNHLSCAEPFRLARQNRRREALPREEWFPTSRVTPTPTPATTSSCTDRSTWWVEQARWPRCMQACLPLLAASSGLFPQCCGRTRQPSTTSRPGKTGSTALRPGLTHAVDLARLSAQALQRSS